MNCMLRKVLQHSVKAILLVTFNFLAEKAKKNQFLSLADFYQNRRIEKSIISTHLFRIEIVKKSVHEYLPKSTIIEIEYSPNNKFGME